MPIIWEKEFDAAKAARTLDGDYSDLPAPKHPGPPP